jgi:AcrR family transcriptional regulator
MLTDDVYQMALTHFAAGGVDRVSVADIASDAGVTIADLQAAHASTDVLFATAVRLATRELTADLHAIAEGDGPPAERVLMMTRRLATPTAAEGTALFAVLREMLDGNSRAETAFETSLSDGFGAFVQVIGEAQFFGEIKPLPPRFIMSVLLSGIVLPQLIGYGSAEGALRGVHTRDENARADDPKAPPRSALLAASIEAVFNGIATSPMGPTGAA